MAVQAYPATTSVPQGGSLDIHLNDDSGVGIDAELIVTEFVTGNEMARFDVYAVASVTPADPAADRGWPVGFTLDVPATWPRACLVGPAGRVVDHARSCSRCSPRRVRS